MTFMVKHLTTGFFASTALATAFLVGTAPDVFAAKLHPVTGETLAQEQTFTYRELDEPATLDPQMAEGVPASDVTRDLFEGLLNQDPDGNVIPGVAKSYDVSDDGKTYIFHLRNNAKWSNGEPVTAADFVYGWQRAADPAMASPYAWFIGLMHVVNAQAVLDGDMPLDALGVKAVDPQTLEVKLDTPLPYFPQMLTQNTTFPAPKATIEKYGAEWTKPENIVSNGAYVLTEHKPGERLVRERNPLYWDNEHTIIDKTVMLVINDENVALTRFLAGELDKTDIPAGQYPRLKQEYPNEAISFPRLCSYYYTFNLSDSGPEAFKDQRVREALSLALDRDIITQRIKAGGETSAYTFTPVKTAGFHTPDLPVMNMTQKERDEKARELMAEAGYGKDHPLSFSMMYNTDKAHQKVAVAASQMWKQKLGVQASLQNMEWKVFLDERGNQNFDMARGAWCGDYNEASTFLDLMQSDSGYNDGKFSNAAYDALLAKAKQSADPSKLYTDAEKMIEANTPIIPIYHYAGVYMLNDELGGWPVNNIQARWYSRELYKIAE